MGFELLFRVDESSLGSHLNERRVRGEEEGTDAVDEIGPLGEVSDSESENETAEEKLAEESKTAPHSSIHITKTDLKDPSENGLLTSNAEAKDSHEISMKDRKALSDADISVNGVSSVTPELEDLIDRALGLGSTAMSAKKYQIDTSPVDLVAEPNVEENKATGRDKHHISKAERRKLKKGQTGSAHEEQAEVQNEKLKRDSSVSHPEKEVHEKKPSGGKTSQSKLHNVSFSQTEKEVNDKKPSSGKASRGQKGKLKKMKEKYADQDEEERRIRMALLASAGRVKKNGESQNETSVPAEDKKPSPEDTPKICYRCKKVGHLSRDCPEHQDGTLHGHANGGVEDDPPVDLDKSTSEVDKVTMEEDDINEIGEEEKEKLNDVDYLTGNPLSSDILLYAVPVCGPYSSVQSYKYHVKIVPGSVKRGKAAKTAMNLFSHRPEATVREKELMKACTDPELVAAIIGNVKITSAGLSQLKQKQKKFKKSSSKAK